MTVDEALDWVDTLYREYPDDPQAILTSEVRRLRAMLEPTSDALDLAQLIEGIVMGTAYSDPETAPSFEGRIKEAANRIIAL